jgi:DNA repair exonuclease SbcCD ATPase subunit
MIKKLILKGAIGIANGKLKRNEIEIDFTNFEPKEDIEGNIIALLGDNGSGKSTILQSCHPYRKAYDKNIKFNNMFKNDNGEKTVIYELYDPKTKEYQDYKFSIKLEKGVQTALVYRIYVDGQEEIINKDESLRGYDKVVETIIGPPDMFFKTYFRSGSDSFLSRLTEGGKKEHFINVLNLKDYAIMKEKIVDVQVKFHSDELKKIKEEEDRIKKEINGDTILKYENLVTSKKEKSEKVEKEIITISNKIDRIKNKQEEHKKNKLKLETKNVSLKNETSKLKNKRLELTKLDEESIYLGNKIKDLQEEQIKIEESLNSILKEKINLENSLDKYEDIEKDVKKEKLLKKEQLELFEKEKNLTNAVNDYKNIEKEYNNLLNEKNIIKEKLEYNKTRTAEDCQLCDYIKEQKRLKNRLTEIEEEIKNKNFENIISNKSILKEYSQTQEKRSEVNKKLSILKNIQEEFEKVNKFRENYNKLYFQEEKEKISSTRIKEDIEKYEKDMENNEEQAENLDSDINDCEININNLKEEIIELSTTEDLDEDEDDLKKQLEILNYDKEIIKDEWRKNSEILNNLKKLFSRLKDCESLYEIQKKDFEEWKLFQDAFDSKKGLPFLELKKSCIAIQDITNFLLGKLGYPLFVEFKTSKEKEVKIITDKGKSKKETKEKDIFEINVKRDKGEDVDLSKLSNGEKVMVESAISLASVIYMKKNNDRIRADQKLISVMFLDEMDGALHKDNVEGFFDLIKLAHKEAHSKQTLFITHNDTLLGPYARIQLTTDSPEGYEIID